MIFVTLGTQKQDFSRALKIIEDSNISKNEKIIVQAGYTKFKTNNMEIFDFLSPEKMNEYVSKCSLVITHGGVGSIFEGLKNKKRVLAIPRLKKYNEHINDHQLEICEALENEGYILYLKDGENLDEKISKLNKMEHKIYENNTNYLEILRKEI